MDAQNGYGNSPSGLLAQYLSQVATAIHSENGALLASLTDPLLGPDWVEPLQSDLSQFLSSSDGGTSGAADSTVVVDSGALAEDVAAAGIPAPYDNFVVAFLSYLTTPDPRDFYDVAAGVFAQFCNPVFSKSWHVPVVKTLCEGLIHLALERDNYLKSLGKRRTTATNLQNRFSWLMSLILVDRPGFQETKSAALTVANIALRFYVRMGESQLCTKLVRQIDSRRLDLSIYPMSQRVTYHFLVGRLKIYYHKFRAAEKHLSFALEHCHKNSLDNRRRIIPLYIVARLIRGLLPKPQLLAKYHLEEHFGPLIAAHKKGNFAEYDRIVIANVKYYSSLGVFTILQQRARMIMFRNLYRLVFSISQSMNANPTEAPMQLDYMRLMQASQFAGATDCTNIACVESIVVALIAQGLIKGYTLPTRGILVVSRTNPFPSPYQLANTSRKTRSAAARSQPVRRTSAAAAAAAAAAHGSSSFPNLHLGSLQARRPVRRISAGLKSPT
ncbi:uncharacterized protein EV422DRAFT_567144 [Fimicolochytrium jonesii]|uniref:uncharacterized protein n=1 Tax=Fimicolochytrium jonesii TaxID=1396493 RepID=UPI0022FEEEF0|nr:uncharacterized protein EV422DRAFT_567144 [Fimicolochytrium jonesii]KAI8821402.1 hypothetical protein EV422DRAFT_567144 [Fimicolochytrium jonesii]